MGRRQLPGHWVSETIQKVSRVWTGCHLTAEGWGGTGEVSGLSGVKEVLK
jgi:hypothetical protein